MESGVPIMINDGVVGRYNCRSKWIVVESGNTDDVIAKAKSEARKSKRGLRRLFMFSSSNEDITCLGLGINSDNWQTRIHEISGMATVIIGKYQAFNREVQQEGGKVILTSLIPRPSEVDPCITNHNLGKEGVILQQALSKVFVSLSDKIVEFNRRNHCETPNIKSYLEVKSRKNRRGEFSEVNYVDKVDGENVVRGQRKIQLEFFEHDYVHPKETQRQKIVKLINRCITREDWKLTTGNT